MQNTAANMQSSAAVVDGALVLTLTGANPPCVWRRSLADQAVLALEARSQDGRTVLGVRGGGDAFEVIASFDDEAAARDALGQAARAMAVQPASGQTTPAGMPASAASLRGAKSSFLRNPWIVVPSTIVATLILAVLVLFSLSAPVSQPVEQARMVPMDDPEAQRDAIGFAPGEPIPAEELFRVQDGNGAGGSR